MPVNAHDEQALLALLRERLTPERLHHSLCVQKQSAFLARLHGAEVEKAALAGLLHDVCRCMPKEAQLQYLRAHGILLDAFTMRYPQLWHAVCGSVYLREELGIDDADILNAVRYHTTARAGMCTLEQVVYLADMTSEDRTYPGVDTMRELAVRSLADAMRAALCHTMRELLEACTPVVYDTWAAYNEYTLMLPGRDCGQ